MANEKPKREAPRYSKVDRRIWNDAKFRALSRPAPNAQTLWFWLLTTDESTNIPGLLPVGRGAILDVLGWSQRAFDKCFAEIEAQGMAKADWDARLVWLPKAIRRNPPDNPNVVRGWWKGFDDLPECALLEEAKRSLVGELKALGNGYAEAFAEAEVKTSATSCRRLGGTVRGNGYPNGMASGIGNQEQEQEQEQEEEKRPPSEVLSAPPTIRETKAGKSPRSKSNPEIEKLAAWAAECWNRCKATNQLLHWPGASPPKKLGPLSARVADCEGVAPFKAALIDRLRKMAVAYAAPIRDSTWAPDLPWLLKPDGWEKAGAKPTPEQAAAARQVAAPTSVLHQEYLEAEMRDGRLSGQGRIESAEEIRPALSVGDAGREAHAS